jgi:hypothetical protein
MAQVVELIPKHRAPPIAEKLSAARSNLATLEADLGQAVLDAEENAPNAAKRLAVLRSQITDAERAVAEYTKAYTLAARIDRQSDAVAGEKMRTDQFAAFLKHGKERLSAAEKMFEAAATMSSAMQAYGASTQAMISVLPAGTSLPVGMSMGRVGEYGGALSNLELLLSAEFWRLAAAADVPYGKRFSVPFGKQPTMGNSDHRTMQPAAIVFGEAHAAIISEIEGQLAKIAAKAMTAATGEPEALKKGAA